MSSFDNKITARAHTNIALIKYWGKQNAKLKIPTTNSFSLTLDKFYTETSVTFKENYTADRIIFNGKPLDASKAARIVALLDVIREMANQDIYAEVNTTNMVPTSAGFASSSSGFAALAAAACKSIGLNLSKKELSRVARRGSGSACRSIYGGFVEWHKGLGDCTSFATPFNEQPDWNLNVIAVMVNQAEKTMSSTKGMEISKKTSPYYNAWKQVCKKDLKNIKKAIKNRDFEKLGSISEENAMRMHALTLSASPDYTYFDGKSLQVIKTIQSLRSNGIPCYFTMDAGPNIKVLVEPQNTDKVVQELKSLFSTDQIVVAAPGPGIEYL